MTVEQFKGLEAPAAIQLLASSRPIARKQGENTSAHYLQLSDFYVEVLVSNHDPTSYGFEAFTDEDERYDTMLKVMHANSGSSLHKSA